MNVTRIRSAQMDAFRQQARESFEERAVGHLRRKLADPTKGMADDELRQRVRSCCPRAEAYGFTSERQIIAFVDATFYLGERFDSDPLYVEVAALIGDKSIAADLRASALVDLSSEEYESSKVAGAAR